MTQTQEELSFFQMMSSFKELRHVLLLVLFLVKLQVQAVKREEGTVTLLFAGDINFDNPVRQGVKHNCFRYKDVFRNISPYIAEADVAIGNLESPIVPSKALPHMVDAKKNIYLNADQQCASSLRFAGFDVMTLANNHFNDFGEIPVNYSIRALKQYGIKSIGTSFGRYDSSQTPLIIERNGVRIGLLGYCMVQGTNRGSESCLDIRKMFHAGPAIYQEDIAVRDVTNLKRKMVDVIAVFLHWGREYNLQPNFLQLHVAKQLTSLGVQVVVGCHPHVRQPHSYHGNKVVAYSIGNLLFYHKLSYDKKKLSGFSTLECKRGRKPQCQTVPKRINPTTIGELFRVQVSRKGVVNAQYLTFNINRNQTNHCLQPTPLKNGTWMNVCGSEDKRCIRS